MVKHKFQHLTPPSKDLNLQQQTCPTFNTQIEKQWKTHIKRTKIVIPNVKLCIDI